MNIREAGVSSHLSIVGPVVCNAHWREPTDEHHVGKKGYEFLYMV